MDVGLLWDWVGSLYERYPLFSYVAAVLFVLLLIWKPVKVLKNFLVILVFLTLLYLALNLVESMNFGVKVKEQGIRNSEKGID